MGREVVKHGGEEMPLLPHQVRSHVWYPSTSLPRVECCQQCDTRLHFGEVHRRTRIKYPALLKNHSPDGASGRLTSHCHSTTQPLSSYLDMFESVGRWAWNRLTNVNEGNGVISYSFWTASSPRLSDIQGVGAGFFKPSYVNTMHRFNPSKAGDGYKGKNT